MESLSIYKKPYEEAPFIWSSYFILVILFLRITMAFYLLLYLVELLAVLDSLFLITFLLVIKRSKWGPIMVIITVSVDLIAEFMAFEFRIPPVIIFGNLMDLIMIPCAIVEYKHIEKYQIFIGEIKKAKEKKFYSLIKRV